MRSFLIFLLYFSLGVLLIFSFNKIYKIFNSQQLKSPLPPSSFSLEVAPSESLRGTIVSLSGDVLWQSRIATEPAKITKPMQIQQGEKIKTSEKGQTTVVFSKNVNLTIFPKTEIDFIQTLPGNILIEQNSGSAEYETLSNYSLNVRSLDLLIKINRGKITLSIDKDQPNIVVNVKKGSITVGYNDINYITQMLNVASGKRLIFRTDTKKVDIVQD